MTATPPNGSDRLDSWKAIAAYLQRDERTVRRWEREQGLPIRRVPGGRGTSVFAYVSEIESWLKNTGQPPAHVDAPANTEGSSDAPVVQPAPRWPWRLSWIAAVLLLAVGVTAWRAALRLDATEAGLTLALTPDALVARGASGQERWRYSFPGMRVEPPDERRRHPAEILNGGQPAVVAATGLEVSIAHETVSSGRLLSFTPGGSVQHTFEFDDRLTFDAEAYGRPWGITDFRIDEHGGARRIALAAHHFEWWPSMVTVLDEQWRRRGTFVNAGWLERVHWLSPERLLVAGFSEAFDGGVVALLDAQALDGQSPVPATSHFFCGTCGSDRPLRYVVMPRSDVNRASASRFNRARLEIHPERFVARTIEASPTDTDVAEALYEYTPSLGLIRASYNERYWELHRSLEMQGKLDHTREQCPDRDGPREIQIWEPQTEWRTVPITHIPSASGHGP